MKVPIPKLPKITGVVMVRPKAVVGPHAPGVAATSPGGLRALPLAPGRVERSAGRKLLRGKIGSGKID
jgi:hypothetical protein